VTCQTSFINVARVFVEGAQKPIVKHSLGLRNFDELKAIERVEIFFAEAFEIVLLDVFDDLTFILYTMIVNVMRFVKSIEGLLVIHLKCINARIKHERHPIFFDPISKDELHGFLHIGWKGLNF